MTTPSTTRAKTSRPTAARIGQSFRGGRQGIGGHRGKQLLRRRGELVERTFAHADETGALRRLYVRGKQNVQKRLLLQAAACNLALLLRKMMGAGTPRALHDVVAHLFFVLLRLILAINTIPVTSRSCRLACPAGYASRSMCSTENSKPEIADLGTGC